MVVPLVSVLSQKQTAAPLAYLGKHTMSIYVLSSFIFPGLYLFRLPHANMLLYTWIISPLAACVLCTLCICGAKVIQLRKNMSLLLLGV
jgi:fucose 4-O-acetylase-like acetyltransferase